MQDTELTCPDNDDDVCLFTPPATGDTQGSCAPATGTNAGSMPRYTRGTSLDQLWLWALSTTVVALTCCALLMVDRYPTPGNMCT